MDCESARLKCLSARFVIDIGLPDQSPPRLRLCLKCLSARFVIDIGEAGSRQATPAYLVSQMPFG